MLHHLRIAIEAVNIFDHDDHSTIGQKIAAHGYAAFVGGGIGIFRFCALVFVPGTERIRKIERDKNICRFNGLSCFRFRKCAHTKQQRTQKNE